MATINPSERSAKLQKALEKTLTSSKANKLVNSAINDLSSSKGLSFRTLLLGVKFALTNPVNTYNLVKLAKSSETYLDPEFQKSLLEKAPIWEFLKKNADNLPKIGKILANAGFKEFQEGNFLDEQGLNILKESFKNDEVLKKLQEVAVEVKKESPDWNQVTSKTLDMLSTDSNFQKFFKEQGTSITKYIESGVKEILPGDYIRAFDDILQKPENKQKYAEVQKIFDKDPALKQFLAENINNPADIKNINKLTNKEKAVLDIFLKDAKTQAKPSLKEYLESYKVDPSIINKIPDILAEVPKIKDVFDTLNDPKQGLMLAIEKTLEMTKDNKELRDFFADNKRFLPNLASGVIENNPALKKMTQDYNFDKQMLNIVGELMSKPDRAYEIMVDVNKGNYKGVAGGLIASLNNPSFKLKEVLSEQSKNGLFNNLIKGVLEQDEKSGSTIKKQLENYGLNAEDVTKLSKLMPLLLDNPDSLQKVWSGFVKGDYTGMAKELITLTKDNPEIKQYLNDNKEIFANILDKSLAEVPGVNKLDKKQLYNVLPSMLNHSDELAKIIEGIESKSLTGIAAAATALYSLTRKTNNFEGQLTNLITAGATMAYNYAVNVQPVEDKITDSNILIDQAVDKVFLQAQSENIRNLPDKKRFAKEIKILCKENPDLKNYIVEKLNSMPIDSVGDVSTPVVNQFKHATDYINSPIQVLNPLYENLVNKEDIKSNLVANMLSEQISQNLFGMGNNRGEDFYMVNQKLKQAISEYVKENPKRINNFLDPKNQEALANNIADTLKSKSKYTLAGLATGGIYLPKEIFNDELKNNFKNEFKRNWQENILAEAKNISSHFKNGITLTDNSKLSPPLNTPVIRKEKGKSNGIT
ncbi:MAG: hypothetical protein RCO49_04170 [Rickettsia endosymbiont of Argas persicus]